MLVLVFHLVAVARPAGLSWNGAWGRDALRAHVGRGSGTPGARRGRGKPRHLGRGEPGWRVWGMAHRERAGGGANLGVAWVGGGSQLCSRGRRCSWECPFCVLLGPHRSASSERSRGVRTIGKGTGTRWSREPRFLPSLLAQSWSPLTWRSWKGLAFGVKAFTALPLRIKFRPSRFSQVA